ncbi:alpha/beta hydrolase [Rhodococcus sp. G-MC3]|uniref:alpha/beta fold hydrolase n=1 Tax=Rhodococcus sp. G-MC3 TaxID=3046209 RepID=UPI0024BA2C9B|nr:alpha/beta hydrolase [Rhodococcus sp. G-MC3]MDJ0396459.1 alpha/beta hydrolase [Rhodococcus sp. G-MC3]
MITDGPDPLISIPGVHGHYLRASSARSGLGRLRYLQGGSGSPVVLLHTVRTQAEHFHRLIPLLLPNHTVYALDLPGMGHSDIEAGARYDDNALRSAVHRFIVQLDLHDVTLIGESIGATLALTASADLPDRIRRVVAVNTYDYAGGIARSGVLARIILTGILAPVIGPTFAGIEPKPVMRAVLHGGLVNDDALTEDYLDELLSVGRRPGYSRVARAIYGNLPSLIAARSHYERVKVPVHLVYGEKDWSRTTDRSDNYRLLPGAEFLEIPDSGHFMSLEKPEGIAALID